MYSSATHAIGTASASGTPSRSSRRMKSSASTQNSGRMRLNASHEMYIIGCATRTHCVASALKTNPPRYAAAYRLLRETSARTSVSHGTSATNPSDAEIEREERRPQQHARTAPPAETREASGILPEKIHRGDTETQRESIESQVDCSTLVLCVLCGLCGESIQHYDRNRLAAARRVSPGASTSSASAGCRPRRSDAPSHGSGRTA